MKKFYVIIKVHDDEWEGDQDDMACWIDSAMNTERSGPTPDVTAIVWNKLNEMVEDNVLEVLADG